MRWSLSVEAEGGEGLLTLAGEISNQLTVADHQKQATACTHTITSSLERTELIRLNAVNYFYLKPATTARPWGTPASLQGRNKTCNLGNVLSVWVSVRLLLTQAGDCYMHERDGEGIVPHPPLDYCSKQKTAAEVGELQGHEIHWEGPTQQKT